MKEQRRQRAYKATDATYLKAKKRATKEKGHIANLMENVLDAYAKGWDIEVSEGVYSDDPETNLLYGKTE